MHMHDSLPGHRDVDHGVAAGRHLAELGAHHQQEVGFLDALLQLRVDADADIADIPRPVVVEIILAAEHRTDRDHLDNDRSEEHTSELQSLMRISYAVFCLKKKKKINKT